MKMKPSQLGAQLRTKKSRVLRRRRAAAGLALAAAAAMGITALYQIGIIRRLPDPPLFNSEKVTASDDAYAKLQTPDAFLGLASYSMTAGLAAMGPEDRAVSNPIMPLALGGKAVLDSLIAARLTWREVRKDRALCFWCMVAACSSFLTLKFVLPEAREAFQNLFKAG